jgi:HEAT repeat protein
MIRRKAACITGLLILILLQTMAEKRTYAVDTTGDTDLNTLMACVRGFNCGSIEQRQALDKLAEYDSPKSVAAILKAVTHGNQYLSSHAHNALVRLARKPKASEELHRLLESKDDEIALESAIAIYKADETKDKNSPAFSVLVRFLKCYHCQGKSIKAARALRGIQDNGVLQYLQEELSNSWESWDYGAAITKLDAFLGPENNQLEPWVLKHVIKLLAHEQEAMRNSAASFLAARRQYDLVLQSLVTVLETGSPVARGSAVFALVDNLDGKKPILIQDSRAIDALKNALKDSNAQTRKFALEALISPGPVASHKAQLIKDPRKIEAVLMGQADADITVRRVAVRALGRVDDPRAENAIVKAMKHEITAPDDPTDYLVKDATIALIEALERGAEWAHETQFQRKLATSLQHSGNINRQRATCALMFRAKKLDAIETLLLEVKIENNELDGLDWFAFPEDAQLVDFDRMARLLGHTNGAVVRMAAYAPFRLWNNLREKPFRKALIGVESETLLQLAAALSRNRSNLSDKTLLAWGSVLVSIGNRKTVPFLNDFLKHRTKSNEIVELAEIFLNCGNRTLKRAAKAWAKSNYVPIKTGTFASDIYWGK